MARFVMMLIIVAALGTPLLNAGNVSTEKSQTILGENDIVKEYDKSGITGIGKTVLKAAHKLYHQVKNNQSKIGNNASIEEKPTLKDNIRQERSLETISKDAADYMLIMAEGVVAAAKAATTQLKAAANKIQGVPDYEYPTNFQKE